MANAEEKPYLNYGPTNGYGSRMQDSIRKNLVKPFTIETWHQKVSFEDIRDASSDTLTVSTAYPQNKFPTNVIVTVALVEVVDNFIGGLLSSVDLLFGPDGTDTNRYSGAIDLFDETATMASVRTYGDSTGDFSGEFQASADPQIDFTFTGAARTALTAGAMRLTLGFIRYTPIGA